MAVCLPLRRPEHLSVGPAWGGRRIRSRVVPHRCGNLRRVADHRRGRLSHATAGVIAAAASRNHMILRVDATLQDHGVRAHSCRHAEDHKATDGVLSVRQVRRAVGGARTAGAVAALGLRRHAADRGPAPGRRRAARVSGPLLIYVKKLCTRSASDRAEGSAHDTTTSTISSCVPPRS